MSVRLTLSFWPAKPKKPKCGSCDKMPCKCKISFSCTQCNYSAKQKLHLEGHVARVHEGSKKFMCDECGVTFWRNSNLRKHVKDTHAEKNFGCASCSYKTVHERSLKYHIESVHEGKEPYKCNICNKGFSGEKNLKNHILTVHEDKKPFNCVICHLRFPSKGTSMYYYTACNCTMCNLLLLDKPHFF